jgi:alpha-L-fucosidase
LKDNRMKKIIPTLVLGILLSANLVATAATNQTDRVETKEQRDARMAWWREAKFGMFIHWGVYSVPAGYYHGKPVNGIGEWIMNKGKIPMAEYQQFAKEYNPVKYNADDWVRAAKDAGMKYIVITAKHHDGFANFKTSASKWNIVDATPYGKDVLQPLAAACRKYDIKLGFYYSQAQDWNNGGAVGLSSTTNSAYGWDPLQKTNMDEYIDKVAVPQVKEICSNYGEFPAVIWWDTPRNMNYERAKKLYDAVEALRPDVIQNNRLGGGFKGDTETPEQHIPAQGYPGRDWETCMTMNGTWGFKKDDNDWKSTETLIRNLCDIASKGGNYLLNVGPTSEGLIPQPSLDRLAEIGRWMKVNGEAIYDTGPTPFGTEAGRYSDTEKDKDGKPKFITAWGWRATTKPGKIYLEIFQWPTDKKFAMPAVKSEIQKAYLLAGRAPVNFTQTDSGVTLELPASAPDKIASVICLELAR